MQASPCVTIEKNYGVQRCCDKLSLDSFVAALHTIYVLSSLLFPAVSFRCNIAHAPMSCMYIDQTTQMCYMLQVWDCCCCSACAACLREASAMRSIMHTSVGAIITHDWDLAAYLCPRAALPGWKLLSAQAFGKKPLLLWQ